MDSKNKIASEDLDNLSGGGLTGQIGGKSFSIETSNHGDNFTISYGGKSRTITGDQFKAALMQSDSSASKMKANALYGTARSLCNQHRSDDQVLAGALNSLFKKK